MKWKIRRSRETALFHFTGPSPQDTSQETQKGTASHVCERRARARELRTASCDLTSSKSRIHSCSKSRSCEYFCGFSRVSDRTSGSPTSRRPVTCHVGTHPCTPVREPHHCISDTASVPPMRGLAVSPGMVWAGESVNCWKTPLTAERNPRHAKGRDARAAPDACVARKTQAAAGGSAAPDGLRRRVAAPSPFGRSRRVPLEVWRAKLWQQS
jgi:hypothetical protein